MSGIKSERGPLDALKNLATATKAEEMAALFLAAHPGWESVGASYAGAMTLSI